MRIGKERRLSLILGALRDLAPAVVWIDEADSEFPREMHWGNNTEASLVNRIKAFIADKTDSVGVLWMLATNYPAKLDPAITRSGRMDLVIPLLCPDVVARGAILSSLVHRLDLALSPAALDAIVVLTEDFSGADLRRLMLTLQTEHVRYSLDEPRLIEYVEGCFPSVSEKDIRSMSQAAIDLTSVKSELPWFDPLTRRLDETRKPVGIVSPAERRRRKPRSADAIAGADGKLPSPNGADPRPANASRESLA